MAKGERLHLQHGPIDLIISVEADTAGGKFLAYKAAAKRFETVLQELVSELPLLRSRAWRGSPRPAGTIARRMHDAILPHSSRHFVTPMAAVAGAVADEILDAMRNAVAFRRAYVNNGGDIAINLNGSDEYRIGVCAADGKPLGRLTVEGDSRIGGAATSGTGGRSLSFGIADAVTVLARTSAQADAAATLIANEITLEEHPAITRLPASEIDPDNDLGDRLVVVHCEPLGAKDVEFAMDRGTEAASAMLRAGLIAVAALVLQGSCRVVGRDDYSGWSCSDGESRCLSQY